MHKDEIIIMFAVAYVTLLVAALLVAYYLRKYARAQEHIAGALNRLTEMQEEDRSHNYQRETALQHKQYRQFLLEHADVAELPSKERHEKFRAWAQENAQEQLA